MNNEKERKPVDYGLLSEQAAALSDKASWYITAMANVSALLFDALEDINWAGFYLVREDKLVLAAFQGKPACTDIPIKKGVCATSVLEDRIVRVEDVHKFPGHIACDSASASEIVLPLRKDGRVVGVLDIDSPVLARFSEEDEIGLAKIAAVIEKKGDFYEGFFKT